MSSPVRVDTAHDRHHDVKDDSFDHDAPAWSVKEVEKSDAHLGVQSVEAAAKVWGRYSKWLLFLGLALASYIYSLDGTTTYSYLPIATSAFEEHSLISSVQVAQQIITAVGKPVIAKLADVTSRGYAFAFVLACYVVGYIVIASAHNVGTIGGGIIIYAIGYTGLQLLIQVIIADVTTLQWRGLVSGLVSLPFVINGFVGALISTSVINHAGWRWGYGMFAILMPVTLSPVIITLLWAERKAKRLELVRQRHNRLYVKDAVRSALTFLHHMDTFGLVLLGAGVALILLPVTLVQTLGGSWKNARVIAMLVVGLVLLVVFVIWETLVASRPVIPKRFILNRSIMFASLIGFFDFVSFYLTNLYLFSFIFVTQPWSLVDKTYFSNTQSVALTIFGIAAGFGMRYFHRYKWILVTGLVIRLAGVGMMIHSRGANGKTVELVWTQILQGIGGGFASACTQVAAQASVPHADVATATATVLLITEIGGAVGQAIAGGIWTNTMPDNLAKYLPFASTDERAILFGSITTAASQPFGSPTRTGVIEAYSATMHLMIIIATVMSVPPVLLSLFMPNWYLGRTQNAVDNKDITGERKTDKSFESSSA